MPKRRKSTRSERFEKRIKKEFANFDVGGKYFIQQARIAKKRGLISKQTKLHGGKFLSNKVLNKIIDIDPLIEAGYVGHKAPRKTVQEARKKGYKVQGNLIVGPSAAKPEGRRFKKALAEGKIAGVKPVSAGHMEIVEMPYGITDLRDMIAKYHTNPELLDDLKTEDEMFLFKIYGNESYLPFIDTKSMLDYFLKYRSIFDAAGDIRVALLEDTFEAFQVFRFNPQDTYRFIRSGRERNKARAMRMQGQDRRPRDRKQINEARQTFIRDQERRRKKMERKEMKGTELEQYRAAARERMRKLRAAKKPGKKR